MKTPAPAKEASFSSAIHRVCPRYPTCFHYFPADPPSRRAVGGETSTRGTGLRGGVSWKRKEQRQGQATIMGINTPKKNRNDLITAEQTLIDGFNRHAAAIPSMVVDGAILTKQDIVDALQSRIDSARAALSTRATWQAAIRTDRSRRDKTKTLVSGVKQGLLVAFSSQLDTLA